MLRFVVCVTLMASMASSTYPSGYSWGYSGGVMPVSTMGYGYGNYGYAKTLGYKSAFAQPAMVMSDYGHSGPITAAVQSRHTIHTYDVPSVMSGSAPLNIDVPSAAPSINFLMRSSSSNINLDTVHQGNIGGFKETASQDEPLINRHTVTRPVVQEVRELISPYRKVTQEVQPVQEHIETILPRGQEQLVQQTAVLAQPAAVMAQPAFIAKPAAVMAQPAMIAKPAAVMAQPAFIARPASAAYIRASPIAMKGYGFGGSSYANPIALVNKYDY